MFSLSSPHSPQELEKSKEVKFQQGRQKAGMSKGKAGKKPTNQERAQDVWETGAEWAGALRAKKEYGERRWGRRKVGIRSWKPSDLLDNIKELVFTIWTMGAIECYTQGMAWSDLNGRNMDARWEHWNVHRETVRKKLGRGNYDPDKDRGSEDGKAWTD